MTTGTPTLDIGTPLRIATRRSALALAQSRMVAATITQQTGARVELVEVESLGDRSSAPLTQFGGVGVFATAVREAVLSGAADLAVHSLKDLPTAPHPDLTILAIPARAAVEDVLVANAAGVDQLAPGASVGTGSPRRRAQLLALRPDLEVRDVRGNIETRIARVTDGHLAAVVLAKAGLVRLGIAEHIQQVFSVSQMLPAPGQGALAIECATDRIEQLAQVQNCLDDAATRAAVTAERTALAVLEAGCAAPLGAYAAVEAGTVRLEVAVFDAATAGQFRTVTTGDPFEAAAVGRNAAVALLDLGAGVLVGDS